MACASSFLKADMKNKVTAEDLFNRITKVDYTRLPDGKTTICTLYIENGFTVHGKSACVDPSNFDQAEGEKWAYEDAMKNFWPFEGYLLAEKLYAAKKRTGSSLC